MGIGRDFGCGELKRNNKKRIVMKRYVLVVLVGMSSLGARPNLQKLKQLNRPEDNRIKPRPHTVVRPEKVTSVSMIKPIYRLRVMHFAQGEEDRKELVGVIRGINAYCVPCFGLNRITKEPCDIVVISDMNTLPEVAVRADQFKKLVLWVRNRCTKDEYEQIRNLAVRDNVQMVVTSPYEKWYMQSQNINTDRMTIIVSSNTISPVPIIDRDKLFLCAGLKESYFKRVIVACAAQGISVRDESYRAKTYGTLENMICMPGIMPDHLLFELLKQGTVPFVPTIRFLKRLGFAPSEVTGMIHASEWYREEYAGFVQYFNSWGDLKAKMQETDYMALAKKMEYLGMQESKDIAMNWNQLLQGMMYSGAL